MPEDFVPLDVALAPSPPPDEAVVSRPIEPTANVPADPSCDPTPADVDETLAAIRRFRTALADAVDVALDDLMRDIACDVLARELQLAPADLAAVADAALKRYAAEGPLKLRAHPEEIELLAPLGLPVLADPGLRRGDLAVELRCGTIDASLGARLDAALARG